MTDIPENMVINFKNGDAVFGSYIPPSDSRYFNVTDFSNIANMFVPASLDRIVFGGGDLNGRVGNIKYSIPEYMDYLPNVDTVVNDHGKEIIKICRTFKTFVLNNLKINEKRIESCFTYQKAKKNLKMTLF